MNRYRAEPMLELEFKVTCELLDPQLISGLSKVINDILDIK